MDTAGTRGQALQATFRDGLGTRRLRDGADGPLEVLTLQQPLIAIPTFEFLLRERVSRFAGFRQPSFARVHDVERSDGDTPKLSIVSDYVPGVRLSRMLAIAEQNLLPLDVDSGLCLIRKLVSAVALLHEAAPDACHGALAAERIVITQDARLVVVEHVLGAALEQLPYSLERYWTDLRIALDAPAFADASAGIPVDSFGFEQAQDDDRGPRFSRRTDVVQIGAIALALLLGRPLAAEEYPAGFSDLATGTFGLGGAFEPLPAWLKEWLFRALWFDPAHAFASAVEARHALDDGLADSGYHASQSSLEAFLAQYKSSADAPIVFTSSRKASVAAPALSASPAPIAPTPVPIAPTPTPIAVTPTPSAPTPIAVVPTPIAPVPTPIAAAPTPIAAAPTPIAAAPIAAAKAAPARIVATPVTAPTPIAAMPFAPAPRVSPPVPMPPPVLPATNIVLGTSRFGSEERDEEVDVRQTNTGHPASFAAVTNKSTSSRRPRLIAAAVVVVALTSGGAMAARRYLATAPSSASSMGTLAVQSTPAGAAVVIDGVQRGVTPLSVSVSAGPHTLELSADGVHRTVPVTVTANASLSQFIEMPTAAPAVGQLDIRTDPSGAKVSVDGQLRGMSPLTVTGLAPGSHAVTLENELGSVKEDVAIAAGTTASLVVPLRGPQGAPVSGWMSITAPAELQVFENQRLLGNSRTDKIMVTAGRHDVEFVNEALGYRVAQTIQVGPGQVAKVKPDWPQGTIAINASPWANVWLDGQELGETPVGNTQVPIGTHEVIFRHPQFGEQRFTTTVTASTPARLSVDMRKK